jgi:ribosomal-protein-alanine N-acetyltransferase
MAERPPDPISSMKMRISAIELVEILAGGGTATRVGFISQEVREAMDATVKNYNKTGFRRPWVSYLATSGPLIPGICAFTSAPKKGRVEIAYNTFPPFENQGVATMMVGQLVAIARATNPKIEIFAQTLAETNASNAILKKLGFEFGGALPHPEEGQIWEWRLPMVKSAEANRQLELF